VAGELGADDLVFRNTATVAVTESLDLTLLEAEGVSEEVALDGSFLLLVVLLFNPRGRPNAPTV
jgi:hypothetical protein